MDITSTDIRSLVLTQKRVARAVRRDFTCGISYEGVHLTTEAFVTAIQLRKLGCEVTAEDRVSTLYPVAFAFQVEDVRFYCLMQWPDVLKHDMARFLTPAHADRYQSYLAKRGIHGPS